MSAVDERRRSRRGSASISTPQGTARVGKAITASAARLGDMPVPNRGVKVPQWQLDSLAYYDQIGAVRYAAQFWARGLTKIRFYVGEKDEKGEVTPSEDTQAIELFERIQDPMGGMVQLTSAYGQLRFLCGECYLVWTPENAAKAEPEKWEVVSVLEMRKGSKKRGKETWSRIEAPGLTPQELVEAEDSAFEPMPNEVIVYRLWKRHPAYSMMADAPMRSVLADCEEVVRCTHTINARLISRLSGPGIFAIPQSWKLKSTREVATQQTSKTDPEADPFQTKLTKAMMAAAQNPGSAESVSPIVVVVPDESTDKGHLYKIWDPNEVIRELDTREKAIHRFAIGVDMPPGKVEGIEGSTHWNAWAIDKEGMEHLTPVANDFGYDLASAYLRPALIDAGRDDWAKFVVTFDAAEAVTNPDEFDDAKVLYDARAVGKKYLRAKGNATDDDAPTDEELAEMIFVQTRQQVEVEGGVILFEEPEPAPIASGNEPDDGEDTEEDMPEEPTQEEVGDAGDLSRMGYLAIGAAEAAVQDVRKTIGLRTLSHLKGGKCPECVEAVKDLPAFLILNALGPEVIAEQEVPLAGFARGAAIAFNEVIQRQLACSPAEAANLQEIIERHALSTVFDTMPGLPPGFFGRVKAIT